MLANPTHFDRISNKRTITAETQMLRLREVVSSIVLVVGGLRINVLRCDNSPRSSSGSHSNAIPVERSVPRNDRVSESDHRLPVALS